MTFSIQPACNFDACALAKICGDSFHNDRNTQLKALGKNPYNLEQSMKTSIPQQIASPNTIILKLIDEESGEIAGWISWGFRGFSHTEISEMQPNIATTSKPHTLQPCKADKAEEKDNTPPEEIGRASVEDDPIKQLEALTGADLKNWMDRLMPDGIRCMFVSSLSVAPKWQSRGFGSALLKWGIEKADKANVFIWVHSSEGAWQMYQKSGFEVIGTLDVDLDQYAPTPLSSGDNRTWGHYVFRYMKRLPRG
ncbi:hypothetical protein N7517_009941 [Penicillium concentricum]|uniref:N-acetyltransferase domain-containing protein n=1 Tax=Penicillium concentricum TaxID=293559 RepID=A0A9W9RJK8_9EURO|nr:uncharacterized protein N7517_009941 [Penicillium concentricum]KAJ5360750.1 hypothetical protein N7517_009941 [Penicillium concentricum]